MRNLIVTLMAVLLIGMSGCSRSSKEGDALVSVEKDDAAMNQAIAKAKATVGDFVRAFHEQKPGTSEYFVKKPYATPKGSVEHVWISVTDEKNGIINGLIANDAEETREVRAHQAVTLNTSEISDWKYFDGQKMVGGFTIRYFMDKMSPKEREDFLKEKGFTL